MCQRSLFATATATAASTATFARRGRSGRQRRRRLARSCRLGTIPSAPTCIGFALAKTTRLGFHAALLICALLNFSDHAFVVFFVFLALALSAAAVLVLLLVLLVVACDK
jgi:hypothetical protein